MIAERYCIYEWVSPVNTSTGTGSTKILAAQSGKWKQGKKDPIPVETLRTGLIQDTELVLQLLPLAPSLSTPSLMAVVVCRRQGGGTGDDCHR
jgi:hypothetical protein